MMNRARLSLLAGLTLVLAVTAGRNQADDEKKPEPKKPAASIEVLSRLGGFKEWVTSAAVTADGKKIATGSYERITIWDSSTFKQLREIKVKLGRFRTLTFSHDGQTVIGGGFRKIGLWNVETGELTKELAGHRAYVTSLVLLKDGATLLSASEDATVRRWNLTTGESEVIVREEEDPVMGVASSPDGTLLATASGDDTRPTRPGNIRLWNLKSGELIRDFEQHDRVATCVAFSPDGRLLVSGSQDEYCNVYEVESGKLLMSYEEHGRPVNAVQFIQGSRFVASVGGGRTVGRNEVHVWDAATGETAGRFEAHRGPVVGLATATDGARLVSTSRDKTAFVLGVQIENPKPAAVVAAADTTDGDAAKSNDAQEEADEDVIRIGMIGLDTSHCLAFAKLLNMKDDPQHVPGCRVVGVYPKGSPDIQSSVSRVPKYTEEIQKYGVKIVDDLDELIAHVDAVLLETNDGRPHLEQVIPVLKAGKPVFIDKPIAGSLTDTVAIFELGRHYKTPLFSSSSLRFSKGAQELRNGVLGEITGCDAHSPCSLEKTHPDLFWYGIHGVETLFTVMGTGCQSVTRAHTEHYDLVVGTWQDGRLGTFRGIRKGGGGYGGTAFGTKGVRPIGGYDGYRPLVVKFVEFFRTKKVPIAEEETLQIYAFMEAADESKRQGGKPVTLDSVLKKARVEAAAKVKAVVEPGN